MKQHALRFYGWQISSLLISVWSVVYAGIESVTQENMAVSSILSSTTHAVVLPTKKMTPEPWTIFVSQSPSREKAKVGETVALGCHFHGSRDPLLRNLTVKWYKEDEKGQRDLMENNVTVMANNTRIYMTGDLSKRDATLTIINVTTSDHGTYFCQVILSNGEEVTGDGTKLRIQRAMGLFGIEDSIGTIIGVLAASIGGLIVLIIVLTPYLRKCLPCAKATHQGQIQRSQKASFCVQNRRSITWKCD